MTYWRLNVQISQLAEILPLTCLFLTGLCNAYIIKSLLEHLFNFTFPVTNLIGGKWQYSHVSIPGIKSLNIVAIAYMLFFFRNTEVQYYNSNS